MTLADLEFALHELRAEVGDALGGDGVALGLVLGHLVLQGDQADGGTLLFLQAEELQDALVVLHLAVDEYEEDLEGDERGLRGASPGAGRFQRAPTWPLNPSAAFLNWSILSWKSEASLGRNMRMWDLISPPKILGAVCVKPRRREDRPEGWSDPGRSRKIPRETLFCCSHLLGELNHKRQLVGLDKIQEVLLGHLALKRVAAFIKLHRKKRSDTNIKTTQNTFTSSTLQKKS